MTEFTSTELARSEAEEKKLKMIAKANEAKLEKGRDRKTGKKDQYQGKYTSGAGGSTGYCFEKAKANSILKTSSGRGVTQETKAEAGRKKRVATLNWRS